MLRLVPAAPGVHGHHPNDPHAKAMEREVNRLLAQLTHPGAEPIGELRPNGGPPPVQPVSRPRSSGPAASSSPTPAGMSRRWGRARSPPHSAWR